MKPALRLQTTTGAAAPLRIAKRQGPNILGFLIAAYVFLLPYQVAVTPDLNFAASDCCLLLVILLAAGQLQYRKPAWTPWHFGLPLVFAMGSFVAALYSGGLSRYELLNKDAGLLLLLIGYAAI